MGTVTADDVAAARPAVERSRGARRCCPRRTISERAGGVVALKAENLQRTGSFKVRGVAAKLAALGEAGCAARRRRRLGGQPRAGARRRCAARAACRCEVYVPTDAPLAKVEAARGQGATCTSAATRSTSASRPRSRGRDEDGLAFVHPFDDPDIVAGQGSLGLELIEDVPDLAQGDRAGGRGRAVLRHRDRGQGRAPGRRGDRRAGRRLRAVPRVAAARRAGARPPRR